MERSKIATGVLWQFVERFGLQIIGFSVTLILSRLLTPTDYGTVALLTIVSGVMGNVVDCGFGQALIQKKNAEAIDFNSVFYFSVTMATVVYALIFLAAPYFARFYGIPELGVMLRVSSLVLVFGAINSVQRAELVRKLLFAKSFKISILASLCSATVGITMALRGCGAWSLVCQVVASSLVNVIASWALIKWRPKLEFSASALRGLFKFGWKLSASYFIAEIYGNVHSVLIGKCYSRADLAFVEKGRSLPSVSMQALSGSIETVSYPVLTQLQDEPAMLKNAMRKVIQTSTFVFFPVMIGLAVCTPTILPLVFGEQWRPAIPYMQLVCLQYAWRPIHSVNLKAILAVGQSGVFLRLEIIKRILGLAVIAVALPFGVLPFMIVVALVSDPLCIVINSWPNRKLLGYKLGEQIKDVLPTAVITILMACVITPFPIVIKNSIVAMACQIVCGAAVYISLSRAFQLVPMKYLAETLCPMFERKIPVLSKGIRMVCGIYGR